MRHTSEGRVRRLIDEPMAVPDADADHVLRCPSCDACRKQFEQDAALATALLGRPQPVPDIDNAWMRLQAAQAIPVTPPRSITRRVRMPAHWSWRLVVVPVPSATVIATAAVVLAGAVGATLLTTVFAPKGASPVTTSSAGIQALADVAGIDGGSGILGGFDRSSGSLSLPFGLLRWHSTGTARPVTSIAMAERETGLDLAMPAALPAGVGSPATLLVQPAVTATIQFGASAATLAGRSLTITAGPAVLVEYGASTTGFGLPTLATFAMARPAVSSADAKAAQLEAYVLSRPGLPVGLAQEIRLLGGVGTVVPLPVPQGASATQVDVHGSAGVLVADSSIGASGVIWDDPSGVVHAAVGLLDQKDILGVANQLG